MCDPVSIGIGVAGLAASLYGASQSAGAATDAAKATQRANQEMMQAQNNAFTQRMAAADRQTSQQLATMQQTMADRNAAAAIMRQQQTRAMNEQQSNLAQENATAESLRAQGDTQAQELLNQTNAEAQLKAQAQREQQQNLLLDQNLPAAAAGPSPGNPMGDETKTAIARRLAEASTNVRSYGSKIAKASAYDQPLFDVGQAITANRTGIMPAQAAESLLRTGAPVRALPAQIGFRTAGSEGAAADEMIRSAGQAGLDTSALQYGNAISLANLGQSNADVIAKNRLDQAKADAAYKQAVAGLFGQLGQLGLYGAGMRGFGGAGAAAGATSVPTSYGLA